MEATSSVVTNQMYNLICAQYEFLQGKSVFEAYRNHYETLGADAMNYKEFDFWYNRFENGEMDLNHDRSKDPKTRGFSDLSMEVVDKIVKKLQWKERSIFRDVSKKCRESVDKYTININFLESSDMNNHWALYETETTPDELLKLEELVLLLKIPNLEIKKLFIFIDEQSDWLKFGKFLKSLNRQIHLENLHLEFFDYNIQNKAMEILPYLKPGVVKDLRFGWWEQVHDFVRGTIVGKVFELEQWKQAKRLTINVPVFVGIEAVQHFDFVDIIVASDIEIEAEEVIRLKEIYSNSPTFESCFLKASFRGYDVRRRLENSSSDGDKIRVEVTGVRDDNVNSSLKFSIQ